MSIEQIIARLEVIRADAASRAEPTRSGYIDPSAEDLAREDGRRNAFAEIAESLRLLLAEAQQP